VQVVRAKYVRLFYHASGVANSSPQTFFITEASGSSKKDSSKPARACNACYETVFPVLDGNESTDDLLANGHLPHYSSIGTLTALPASRSMPSLLLNIPTTTANVASAPPSAPPLEYSFPVAVPRTGVDGTNERPKSGIDLMSFARPGAPVGSTRPPSLSRLSSYTTSTANTAVTPTGDAYGEFDIVASSPRETADAGTGEEIPHISHSKTKATFSLPAVAVHTTPVTTHASGEGYGRSKRFSLVLGSRSRIVEEAKDKAHGEVAPDEHSSLLDRGATVGRLAELLGRKRS
jgi:FYVE/RhoGEF/PH domain-containing protein 5/6